MANNNKGKIGDDKWLYLAAAGGIGAGLTALVLFGRQVFAQPPPPSQPPVQQPTATLSITPTSGTAPLTATATVTITDPDNKPPYTVRLLSGTSTLAADIINTTTWSITLTFSAAGTYSILASVKNALGKEAVSNTVTVTVTSPTTPTPTPTPSPVPTGTVVGLTRDEYYNTILSAINSASKNIYMHMYLMEPNGRGKDLLDALIAASKRLQTVRVTFTQPNATTTDPSQTLNYLSSNGFNINNVKVVSGRAKVVLIDYTADASGLPTGGVAYIGTENWTDQSLSYNHEFNAYTSDVNILDATKKFLDNIWNATSLTVNTASTVENQFITTELLNRLTSQLSESITRIYITINHTDYNPTSPDSTPNTKKLIDAIVAKASTLTDVKILLDSTFPAAARDYLRSQLGTTKVKVYPKFTGGILQAKTFLLGNRLYISSQNWTNSDLIAARGATISTTQSGIVTKYINWFNSLWASAT
jgi:hypothetical protein